MANLSVIRKSDADNAGIPRVRATVYDSADALPLSGNTQGEQAFIPGDSSTDTLYIWDGGGWYKMALIQSTPSFTTGPSATYTLSNAGDTTVITLLATDPEGTTIIYSATTDVGFDSLATVSQDSSVFTVTPRSEDSANTTSGTITFKASDGISFASSVSTFSLTFSNKSSSHTTVLVKATGNDTQNTTYTDASTNSNTVTASGGVYTTAFTPFHPGGYSAYFDGENGSYIDVAASDDFDIGSAGFTLECWIKTDTTSADVYYRRVFMMDGPSGNSNGNLQLIISASTGGAQIWTNSGDLSIEGSTNIGDNYWHHVAIVRYSNTITLYVDGKAEGNTTYSSQIGTHNSGEPRPRIGSYNGSSGDFKGYIHELRLIYGSALYQSAFAVPSSPFTNLTNTKLLLQHDTPFTKDGSDSTHSLTVNKTQQKRDAPPYQDYGAWSNSSHGGSIYFDGTGHLAVNHSSLAFAQNDYTIEFWFYPTTAPPGGNDGHGLFHLGNDATGAMTGVALNLNNSPDYRLEGVGQSGWDSNAEYGANVAAGYRWHHYAMVRDFSAGTRKAYLNGVQVMSKTGQTDNGDETYFVIGRYYDADAYFVGYIKDFRYVVGSTVYTSAFTPPTSPLTAITNTQLLIASTPSIYDAAGGSNAKGADIKLMGHTKSSTGTTKYAASSMEFDGTGDYITFKVEDGLGSGDFTIECWCNQDTQHGTNHRSWFSSTRGTTGFNASVDKDGDFHWYDGVGGNSRKIDAASVISLNTWYHVAFVRHTGVIRGYLNGTQQGSDYTSTTDFSAEDFAIGHTVSSDNSQDGKTMDGHIEDFRLTKGIARYPFYPLKETISSTTSWQIGKTVGNNGADTKLIMNHSSTITEDGSATGRTLTVTGATANSAIVPGDGMKSVLYNNSSSAQYIKATTDTDAFAIGTGDYTFETWVNFSNRSNHSGLETLACTSTSLGGNVLHWHTRQDRLSIGTQTHYVRNTPNFTWVNDTWYHVAICRASATTTIFVNGIKVDTFGSDTTSYVTDGFTCGANQTGGNSMRGYQSNTRFVVGTALYSVAFTPPTAALVG